MGTKALHTASLSAQSYPAPSTVFVRVSFVKFDEPLSQAEVRREVQANRQQVLRDLASMWETESATMWAGLAKNGVKEVGRPSFAIENLGGQMAMIIRYGRTSSGNPARTMRVSQIHVPMGADKVLISLTYQDGDAVANVAHDRLKASIVIR